MFEGKLSFLKLVAPTTLATALRLAVQTGRCDAGGRGSSGEPPRAAIAGMRKR